MAETLKKLDKKLDEEKTGPYLGIRHLQVVFLLSNLIIIFVNRLNVSVTLVAMTNAVKSNAGFPEYNWTEAQKSYIISSAYWGNIFVQLPAGYLTQKYGVKINLLICTLGTGLFTLLVPFSLAWGGGWEVYCALRLLQGVSQGCHNACLMQHLAKWCPPAERNRLGGFAHTGFVIGTIMALAMPGFVVDGPLGWPGVFYISAGMCFIWCVFWLIFGADDVSASKFITQEERAYIENSLQQRFGKSRPKIPIPWRAILHSPAVYALIISRMTQNWGYFMILTELPTYFHAVLHLHIRENALYSALPYLAAWVMSYFWIYIADYIMDREYMSLTNMRKLVNSISVVIPVAGLIWFGFLDAAQKQLAIVLMSSVVGINSGTTIGTRLGAIDLAPNHAGMLASVVNTCGNMALLLTPLFAGAVIKDARNRFEWQIVFTVTGLVVLFGGFIFLIFGSAEQQPWNAADFLQVQKEEKPLESFRYTNDEFKAQKAAEEKDAAPVKVDISLAEQAASQCEKSKDNL